VFIISDDQNFEHLGFMGSKVAQTPHVDRLAAAGTVFSTGYLPGGWGFEQALLVLGFFTLMNGFANAVLRVNLSRIVRHVQHGTLDFVLLKPIDSQFWLSTRNVSLWGGPTVVRGVLMIAVAGYRLELSPGAVALGVVPIGLGLVILYSMWFMLAATSIWFVKVYNVTEVLRALLEAGKYPVAAYPAAMRFFFTFIVPVAFMTTVPAEVMLEREAGSGAGRSGADLAWLGGPIGVAIAAGIAVGLFLASRSWRRFALRHSTSASS